MVAQLTLLQVLFSVLVVDPPWAYGRARVGADKSRTAERHYDTIGNAGREINRRTGAGVQAIIESVPILTWAAADAHLFLWTTNPKLPFAFAVMEAWGFTYKTTLTWVKTRSHEPGRVIRNGQGFFFRGATEHCLFGVRGHKPIPSALREPNVILAPRQGHSVKPDAFYALVERVSPGPRADVFARRFRPKWHAWGKGVGVVDGSPREAA